MLEVELVVLLEVPLLFVVLFPLVLLEPLESLLNEVLPRMLLDSVYLVGVDGFGTASILD